MASIKPGRYSVSEILGAADFNLAEKAAHPSGGVDHRRVRVGGLPFDSTDHVVEIPPTTDEVVISVDGKADSILDVELDDSHKALREYSFLTAADADGPAPKTKAGERVASVSDDADADGPEGPVIQFDRSKIV